MSAVRIFLSKPRFGANVNHVVMAVLTAVTMFALGKATKVDSMETKICGVAKVCDERDVNYKSTLKRIEDKMDRLIEFHILEAKREPRSR